MILANSFYRRFFYFLIFIFLIARPVFAGSGRDSTNLGSFIDGLIADHLKSKNVAGATVSIVMNGKIIFSKGYGLADVEHQRPVNADSTLFRIGSISKLFVWTSVMQLAEQGRLDLDADVNQYLKEFKIPATYQQPITLRSLMTHSAGFEDRVIGLFGRDEKSLRPLGEILEKELPERVRPVGEVTSYSNHGSAIAAYIVEQVSGMRFIDYVEKNIIGPLGMKHFSFGQPLPDSLKDDLSGGYAFTGGKLKAQGFEYIPLYPVGAASSSATGMANFMIAQLQWGKFGKISILDSAMAVEMRRTQFRNAPGFNGFGLGFMKLDHKNHRIIGHGGDTFWFHSVLALLPDHNSGLFLSLNTAGGSPSELAYAIIDYMFPEENTAPPADSIAFTKTDFESFEGYYRANRYCHSDLSKIAAMAMVVPLSYNNGKLVTSMQGKTSEWIRKGDLTFREKNGPDKLAFRRDARGKMSYMFFHSAPYFAMEKVPLIDTPGIQYGVLILSLITFLFTLVYWPAAWAICRIQAPKQNDESHLRFAVKILAWISSFLAVFYLAALGKIFSNPTEIAYGIPSLLKIIQGLPVIIIVFLILVIGFNFGVWKNKNYRILTKVHFTWLSLFLLAFEWQLFHWNLLGWNYK